MLRYIDSMRIGILPYEVYEDINEKSGIKYILKIDEDITVISKPFYTLLAPHNKYMTLDLNLNESEIELYNNMSIMGEVVTPCTSKINTRIQEKR